MSYFALSALINVATSLLLGFFIYTRERANRLNQSYLYYCLAVALWSAAYFYWQVSRTADDAIFYSKLLTVGSILIPPFYSYFVHQITKIKYNPLLLRLLLFSTGSLLLLNIGDGLVTGVAPKAGFIFWPTPGIFYPFFLAYWFVIIVYSVYLLLKAIKNNQGIEKAQLKIVLTGTVIGYLCGATNFPLWYGVNILPWGNIGASIYMCFVAYSIVEQHLFDIRVAIRRTFVYSVLLATLFSAYSLFIFLSAQIFSLAQTSNNTLIPNFLASLILGFSFDPLRRWLQDRTDKFLYRKEYAQQTVLKDLSTELNNVIGMDEALEAVMQTIVRTFKIQHAITYVFQPGESGTLQIKRIKQIGYSPDKNLLLQERDFVVDFFTKHSQTISLANLQNELAHEERQIKHTRPDDRNGDLIREHARKQSVVKRLHALECEVAVPLQLGTQSIGLILLSGKLSQENFSESDLELLALAGEVAISSIQKARLYEGDQMKNEFVSIASHELLTPISAIEGYLSMILDEHIGKVDDQARGYLDKVYISSRRLSQLVKDLLSVSRIESGKMTINPQAVNMEKLIMDTTDQLRFIAQKKGLQLNYEAPARELPMVRADPDRVTQVLINLVSNAIKYTPSGSVTIKTARSRQVLKIEVSDTGLGMSREQRLHLFEKFYRVDAPETVGIVGTGLGLYITKSILERMGGTISVQSVPKRGSSFTITLPIFESELSTLKP